MMIAERAGCIGRMKIGSVRTFVHRYIARFQKTFPHKVQLVQTLIDVPLLTENLGLDEVHLIMPYVDFLYQPVGLKNRHVKLDISFCPPTCPALRAISF